MTCTQAYSAAETTMIIIGCLAAIGITAAWVIIILTNVVKWAVPIWLPAEEDIVDVDPTPPPQLNAVQEHYRQALSKLGEGWIPYGGEVDDAD